VIGFAVADFQTIIFCKDIAKKGRVCIDGAILLECC
jgi:hypothetical protein